MAICLQGFDASPDDIFAAIKQLITAAENKGMNIESGSYEGTSSSGGTKNLYCSFNWKIFYCFDVSKDDGKISHYELLFKPNGHGLQWSDYGDASLETSVSVGDKYITVGNNHHTLIYNYTFFG